MELSDRIGYVDGGLQEEEILDCLKRPKKSFFKSFDFNSKVKDSKCSICQVSSYLTGLNLLLSMKSDN